MSELHAELAALQSAIGGQVILPDSPAYEEARKPTFAQYASIRPAAIVRCRTPADVAAAVALAQDLGLSIATRSGRHCFAGRSTTRGVVIDLSPLSSVELQGTAATIGGGAYNRVQPHATAFAHRNERFLFKHAISLGGVASNSDRDDARNWLTRSWALAHPYGSGGVFPNFADPDLDAWATAYHRSNRNRLLKVKARYDPANVFRFDKR